MNFILPLQPKKETQRTTLLLIAFFLGFISFGYSQGTFNSAATDNWGVAGTWTLTSGTDADGIPDSNDVVFILNTHTVSVSDGTGTPSTHACSSITINSGGILRTNSGTVSRTLNVINSLTILAGGTYTVNDAFTTNTHYLNIGGNFTNNGGTFTPLVGSTNLQVTFNGTGAQLINGTVVSQNFNSVIVNKSSNTLSVGGSTTSLTTSDFTLSLGNFNAPATFTTTGSLNLSSGVYTAGANTNIGLNFTNNGGSFVPSGGIVTFNGTGAQSINGTLATQSFANLVVNKSVGTLLSVGGSTNTLNVTNFTQTQGDFTAPATLSSSGGFTLTTGTYTAGTNLNVTGNFTRNGGTFTAGTGTVTLNGAGQTLGGTVSTTFNNLTINNGLVTLGRNTASNGTLSIVIPGALALSTFNYASNGPLSLNGATISGTGTLTLAGNAATSASATTSTISAPVSLSSTQTFTVANGASSPDLSITSIIAGAAGLIKSGTGELTLSGANTFTGGVTLTDGTLNINNSSALGTVAGTFTISGGTINNTSAGAITTLNYPQAWNGDFTFTGTQNLNLGTGAITPNANRLVTVNAATLTVNGVIGGGVSITKDGAGTLLIGGSNTFTGGVNINAGTLRLGNAGALNSTTPNPVTFGAGSTGILQLNGNSVTISALNTNATVGSPIVEDGVAGTHTLTIDTPGANTFAGLLRNGGAGGTLAIVKAGAGSLTISGNNSYTGSTTLSNGTLNINSATAIGTGTLVITGGAIDNTSGGALTLTSNNPQSWNSDFTFIGTQSLNLGSGAVTPNANRLLTINGSTLTIGGIIGGGAIGISKSGNGQLTLSGANTFSGGFTLNAGTLNINNASALGTVAGTFTINGGTIDNTTGGAISTLNYPQSWNSNFTFVGTQSLNLGSGNVSFAANRTITVSANTLTVGGIISASTLNLTKLGNGTLNFGSNPVSINSIVLSAGTLTSTSGTLTISGDFTNSGTFNNNGGTVLYNGIVPQAVASVPYNNLTLSGAGQKNASGNCTVAGNLTNSAVFDVGNNTLSVTGTINNTGGTIRFSGASNAIALNTGTIEYYGPSQLVTAGIYNNLIINQSSGEALLAGDVTVNGVLTLASGRLNIGSFNLILGPTASISVAGPTASKMIVATGGGGEVRKIFTANGTFTFPIGDNTGLSEYSPITVAVSGTGYSSAYVGVSVADAKHPSNASAVNFLSRYWNVTQSGITAGAAVVTATYVNADISGSEAAMTTAVLNGIFNQTSNPWVRYLTTVLGGNSLTTTTAVPIASGQTSVVTAITRANPMVNIVGGGVSSCSGSPVSLTANGVGDPGFIYSWLPVAGLSSAVIANPIASPTTTTVYTVTATDGNGIQASNNTTITVNPLPTLTAVSQSATVCAGSGALINLTGLLPGSTSTISYSINGVAQTPVAGVVANGAGAGSFTTSNLSAVNNGQNLQVTGITVTSATPNCSSSFAQNALLSVHSPALITVQPIASTTLCVGSPFNLSVTATGTGLTYQWLKGASNISGATGSTFTIPSVVSTDAGLYSVIVTSAGVCLPTTATSAASTLTINTSPVITTQPIASQTVCEGALNTTFSVVATGTGLTYQWKKNGVDIGGATSATYTIPTAATGDAGTYTVQVSGTCAPSVTSTGSVLNINEQPEIITVTGNQTVCEGASVTFTVNAGVTTSPTYQWRFNGTPIGGATNSSYTIATTTTGDAGSYDVVVSGACAPSATSAASTLTINTSPVITTQPIASQTVCEGALNTTFSVVATGTGLTYQWKKNGVDIGGATSATYTIPTAATGDAGTYTVQVSGTCAPSVTSTGSVLNINEQPEVLSVTGNQTVCEGASVTFTVNAGVTTSPTYQWRFNGTPIGGATNSSYTIATTTTGDAGSYDVVVSGACAPSATSAASTLTINTSPVITTQPIASQTVCEGTTNVTFSVVATGTGLTYQWKKNGVDIGGATSATYTIPTAATGDAGTYTVQVSGTCAPSVTSTGSVLNINEQPEVLSVTGNQTVCEGASVTFTVNAGVTTSPTYQWRFNGTPIGGATNSSYTIAATTTGDAGSYDVVVSGACAPSATSAASTLTINTSPVITTQPIASQTVCEGALNTTFSVVATGTGLTYQWKKNGVDIGGATSATYTIPTAATGDAGTYTVQVSGTCAPSVTSTGSVLNINEQPEIITVTGNQTVCEGASVTFTVNAGVTTSPTYQWRFNGTPIGGATNSSYTIATTTTGDAGSYDVVVSGACAPSATSAASTLTINTSPVITTQPIASQTVCEGALNTTFSVVATGTGLTYQWKKNGVDIGGATAATYTIPTAATGDAGTYTVQVSGTCAPSVTSTGSVLNINEQPEIITVTGNQTVCEGASVTFTVNAGVTTSPTYQWRFNGTPIGGATNSSYTIATTTTGDAGSYDVVVSGACAPSATSAASTLTINTSPVITTQPIASQTVCEGALNTTFSVVATGTGLTYQWKKNGVDIGGATSATYTIPTAATGDAGTYTVQVSGTCAPSVTSTGSVLNINEQPEIITVTGNQTVCEGASVTFTVNAGVTTSPTYQWRFNGTPIGGATNSSYTIATTTTGDAGSYDVVVSGACAPSATSAASTLTINTSPVITTQPIASQTVCEGALNTTFSVVATGTGLTYQWKKNGVDIGGATSATYTIPTAATGDAGTYTVQVSGTCAPSVTSTGSVLNINEQPEVLSVTGNQTVCEGASVTFTVNAGVTTSPTYQWRFNGTPIGGATNSSYTIATTTTGDAGSYDVVVSGACAPSATSAASTLTINTSPVITTQPIASQTVCEGTTNVTFSVVATGTGLTYQWKKNGVDIGGATSATYTIPTAATGDAGTYTVQVSGTCAPSVTSTGSVLNINEQPEVLSVTGNQTVCEGASVTFTVNAGVTTSPTYQWRFNGTPIGGATNSSYTIAATTTGDAGSYDVVVSGACAPSATSAASTLTINTSPVITTQPIASQTVCEGALNTTFSVVATGTGLTYQWKKNGVDIGGATSATYTIPTAATGDAGTYTVQVSGTCAPSVTSTGSVLNINEQPEVLSVTGNQTVCEGASVTFTVNAGVTTSPTYQWRFNGTPIGGATNSSYTIAATTTGDAGSYDVVVSGACAPSATSAASTLTINTSPVITTQPIASQTVCEGTTNVTFSVVATGTGLTYQWKKNGVDIGGATSASYVIATAATGDAGTYTVQVSGTCAPSVTSTGSVLNINEQPEVLSVTGNQTVCEGASVTFTVNAGVTTSPTYQWRFNGTPIGGATNSSYTIATTTTGDAGSYDVVVSGACAPSATSAASTLTINTSPVITTQPIASQTVCEGALNTTFSVVATGTGLTYQWKKNGVDIGGATSATYTIPTAATGDAGTYTVQVSGTCAPSVTSTGSVLNINEQPEIITVTGNQTVCEGASVTFTVNAGVTTSPTYQWRFNGTPIGGATNSSYTIATTTTGDAGSYDVVVSGACAPSATSAASTLTINTSPVITTQPIASQTVCEGALNTTFSVVATGTGLTYQWKKNGVDIGGATSATYTIPTAATGDAGTYTVQVSGTCAPSVTSTGSVLNINEQPEIITVTGNQTVCEGASVTFTVNAGVTTSPTYQWRFNGTPIGGATNSSYTIAATTTGDAGSYDVVVSGACAPTATSAASTLTINTSPVITTQPIASQTVCEGALNTTFSVVATGTGLTYQWKKNGVDIGGATSATYTIPTAATGDAGTYTVQVSGTCAPSVTSTGSILNINEQPEIITVTGNQTVCEGASVTFTVNAGVTTTPTYQWRFNGTPIGGATNSSYTIATTTTGDAGNYDVVVSGACAPSATSAASTLTINTSPVITTQPVASQTVCEGALNTTFSVVATGTGLTYQWKKNGVDIGGATSATYTIPTAATGDAGTYTVQVSGTCAPSVTSTGSVLNINEQPEVLSVTGNQTVCEGASVTFTVNAGVTTSPTYQWRFNGTPIGGATNSSYTIATTTTGDAGSYDVVVSGACAPSATSAASTLTINTSPVITTQPIASQTVCEGALNTTFSVVATGTGLTYQWKKNGVDIVGATSATYTIPTAATGDAGTYTVQVSGTCAPSVTSTGSVLNINEQPEVLSVTGNQTVCEGASVTFTVNAGVTTSPTYQWRFNGTPIGGATNSSYTIATTTTGDAGNYDVVVSGACAPSATSAASTLTINTSPVITTQPVASQTVCEGALNTTFSVVATGTGLTYQWKKNGVDIVGATSATYTIPTAATGDAGTYTVQVSGTCAPSVTSTGSVLNINEQPEIITVTGNQTVCEGASVTFTVNAGVTTSPTYQWRFNGTPIGGATNSSYTIATTTTGDAGSYDVVVSGACAPSATSAASTLTINTSPVITTQPVASQTVCEGALNTTFSVVATGTGLTYQWKKNGVDIVGATSATYTIPTAATGDAGTYTVQVSGTCAPSVTSTGSVLNINEQPEIITVTGNQTVCEGASVTFTVNAGVTTSPTYQWRFNGTPIGGATNSSYTIATTTTGDAGSYDVVVSGACAPSATSAASTLTINTSPVITTQPVASQTVCEGTTNVTFSVVATGTGLTYQWKKNGVDIVGATSATYTIPTAATGDAGTYTVQVSGTCAPSVTSTGSVLNINEQPEVLSVTGNQTVCEGASVTFTVNAGVTTSPTYQWRFNGTPIGGATNSSYTIATTTTGDAGSYDVVVSGACAPSATSAASTLTINTSPVITTQPIASQTVCEGTTNVTFSVVATGTGLTYQWKKNGVDIVGATSATYTIPTAATGDAGTYTVQVSGTCAPSVTSTGSVLNINEQPEIITVTGNQTVCEGASVTFTVNAGVTTSPTYQWRFNGTPIGGATNSSYTIATTTTGDAGNYDVVVSGACAPSATSAASTLTINTSPVITTQPVASQTVCEGALNTTFSVVATGTGLTYQWKKNGVDIGGATSATYTIPTAATGDAGTYTVQVSGTCAPSVTSTGSILNINEQPEIITVTGNQTVCEGASVTFTVNAGVTTSPTYQWRFNGTPIGGATNSSYTIATTTTGDAGSYDVVVSGACAPSATSAASTLTINELPEVTLNPSNSTICENGATSFTVNSGATTSPTFQWQVSTNGGLTYSNLTDGGIYSGSTSNTLALTNVPLSQNGNLYKVIIGGACPPTAVSSVAQLNVQQNPVIIDQPTNKIMCENTTVLFSVNSVGTGLNYQWRENGIPITNGGIYSGATTANLSLANIPASLNGNGYDVVITGTCSAITSSLATLTVNPLPVGVNEAITICSDIALNYDLQTNINSSNGVVSTYSWVASNNLNVLGESLGIQSSSAITDKLTNQSTSSQIVTYTITPTSVTGLCQGASFTLTVTIDPEPVGITQNVIQCSGVSSGIIITSAPASVSPSGFNIVTNSNGLTQIAGTISAGLNKTATELQDDVWSNSGVNPVNVIYTITPISSIGGCLGDSFVIMLTITPEPVGVAQTKTVCSDEILGSGVTLTTNGTSVSAASYTINSITFSSGTLTASAGSPVTGSGKPANELINDSWTNQTGSAVDVIYNVSPVSSAGCVGAPFTITVTVQPEPVTTANVVAASVCSDVVTGYTLSVVGATTYTISTNSNGLVQSAGTVSAGTGKLANELSDDSWTNTTLSDVNVVYTITPVSGVGCAGDVFTVTVGVKPEPRGVNASKQICSNSSVSYDLQTSNIDVLGNAMSSSYSWLAADNTNVTGESLTAQTGNVINNTLINTTGVDQVVVYTVTPTGTVSGCVGDNFTITVTVKPEPVGVSQTHTVCSDAVLGSGLTLTTNGTSVSAASYTINSITFSSGTLTASAGIPVTGTGKPANELINDSWTNQTGSAVDVIYNVSPVSSAGCVGAPFTITVTVQPEPVTTANVVAASVCSDVVTGYTLSVVDATTYTISTNSNGLVQSAGTVSAGTGKLANELSDDSWTNTTLSDVNVVYTITPVSGVGCAGDVFTVTVGVKPEPRGVNASKQICSNSSVSYDLQTSNIDVLGNAMSSSYSWLAADNTNVTGESLTAQTGNVINNTLINTTGVDQVVVYTVTPTGTVSGCVGDNFIITVTVKPEPVGVAQTANTCSDIESNYNLIINIALLGNNVGSTFTWIATANPNVTGESTSLQSGSIITDKLTNVTNSDVTVTYTVTPTSVNGCTGSSFVVSLIVKPEPVGTSLAAPTICSGSPVNYNLQGNINLSNGLASNFTWIATANPSVSGASVLNAQTTSTITDVLVNTTFVPQVVTYTVNPIGINGCAGDPFTIDVTINPKAQISAGPNLAHCSNISSIQLQGLITYAPNGIIWSGGLGSYSNGTSTTSNYSYSNPTEINQLLTLTITANDPDGAGPCLAESDQMNLKINPLPTVAFFGLPASVAENIAPFNINGNQRGGVFSITPGLGISPTSINTFNVDEATFDPGSAELYNGTPATINTVTYTFTDVNSCTNSTSQSIIVNALTVVNFTVQGAITDSNGDFLVCNETGDVELIPIDGGNPGKLPETGFTSLTPGLTLKQVGTKFFIPTTGLVSGTYSIRFRYRNASDVISDTFNSVKILSSPIPSIIAASNCIDSAIPLSGSITFPPINPYPPDPLATSWNWNFGDNISQTGQNVSHTYASANVYTVTLNVRTSQGCVGTASQNVRVGDVPNVDFDWSAICTNDQTSFKDLTTKVQGATPSGISSIVSYTWDFGDGDVLSGAAAASVPPATHGGRSTGTYKLPNHNYVVNGTYDVKLSVTTNDGCFSTVQRSVFILPGGATVQPTADVPYVVDFNGTQAGWIPEGLKVSTGPVVISPFSWQHGPASGATIVTPSGNDVWWTGKNSNSYYTKEQSVVNGPCFDLTQLERPMVALDYWSDTEQNIDGAVLQYSTDGGFNWELVGPLAGEPIDQGVNWYNEKGLPSNPGQNSSFGWTGKQVDFLTKAPRNARYNLDIVPESERAQVRVRIAFGSNDGNEASNTYDGFAFDNFFVGEKKRIVLMEHFTNSSLSGSLTADDYINDLYNNQIDILTGIRPNGQSDFNQIQYHISYSSANSDLLNADNPNDPNTRASNYGVSQPPKTFMDGIKNAKFDGTFTKLNKIEVDRRALKDPKFTLKLDTIPISVNDKSNYISVRMTITADTIVNVPLIAQVALVEDDVPTTTPNRTHKNVLRKLLFGSDPTKPDGITISTPFAKGDVAIRPNPTVETQINVPIKDWTKLKLIGFIQDKNTGEIYQSTILNIANKKVGSTIVGVEPENPSATSLNSLQIYPNPANGKFNFAIPGEFPTGYIWKISDQRGVFVKKGDFSDGANGIKSVDVSDLINGVYFVLIGAEGQVPVYRKLIVMNQH